MTRARNSANLASDGNLFVDIANDRTGIGSVVPAQNLHVAGTAGFHADTTFVGDLYNATWDRSDNSLKFVDNAVIKLGNNNDLSFAHDGTASRIQDSYGALFIGSNLIELKTANLGEIYLNCTANGAVSLRHNNVTKFATTAYGTNTTGTAVNDGLVVAGVATVTTMNVTGVLTYDDVTSVDSVGIVTARQGVRVTADGTSSANYISVGAGNDLKIWHQTSNNHSYISESGGGSLVVLADDCYIQDTSTNTMISAKEGAEVNLHFNGGTPKLSTTNTGVSITGTASATTFVGALTGTASGNPTLSSGSNDRVITATGSNALQGEANLTFTGSILTVTNSSGASEITLVTPSNSDSGIYFNDGSNDGAVTYDHDDRELRFRVSSQNRWKINVDGHLLPGAVGSYDIGSTSAEIRNLYLGDVGSVYFGEGQDVRAYYDPTGSASFTIDSTAGYMYINSDALRLNSKTSGWSYLRGDKSDGVVKLYKSNSQRLATSDTGITVTGEVAATQDYPDVAPSLDLNFTACRSLDPRVTYRRTGNASYVNEFGKIVFAGENEPRFDHDPTTRKPKGLLIEEARYNYFAGTANMGGNSGRWSVGGSRGTRGVNVEGPDGTMTALQNVYNGTSGDLNIFYETTNGATEMSTNNNSYFCFSVFAKAEPGNSYINGIRLRAFNPNRSVSFNVINGTVGATNEGSSSIHLKKIIEYPNGWYRCIMGFTSGTDGNQGFQIYVENEGGDNAALNSSGANGEAMYFWGAQLENGYFPTSYIPTYNRDGRMVGRQTQRAADQAYIDGQDFLDFYNQTEGTVVSTHSILDGIPTTHNLYTYQIAPMSPTSNATLRLLDKNGSYGNSLTAASVASNTTTFLVQPSGSPASVSGRTYKVAVSIKENDFDCSFDGSTVQSDNSGALPTADHVSFGYYKPSPQAYLNGHLERFIYYPAKLSNNQLITLSS